MALNQLTVLNEMPRFTGNPKPGEVVFKPDIDARTFMRTVENYYSQNNVTSDEKKLHILFSLMDKKRGDAIRFLTCYAGRNIPFAKVKEQFLMMYPSFKVDDFPHAAKSLLDTQLTPSTMFCGITTLENTSRAAAEAYLSHQPLTKNDFDQHSLIAVTTVIHVPPASSVPTVSDAAPAAEAPVTPRPRI
jgi:hypothetical protein